MLNQVLFHGAPAPNKRHRLVAPPESDPVETPALLEHTDDVY